MARTKSNYVPQSAGPFKAGEVVTIYEDPFTRQKPEGRAVLVRCVDQEDDSGMSRWVVRFPDDEYGGGGGEFERLIVREAVR